MTRAHTIVYDTGDVYGSDGTRDWVRAAGVATVVDGRGPEMDRAETVTVLNDLCLLAPAAVVALSRAPAGSPALAWTPIDDRHARVTYTRGAIAVSATLEVDDRGALVDFVSDDRLRASRDGATFTPMRWSTPVAAPRAFGPVTLAARGEARWHPADAPAFAYAELALVDVVYDVADPGAAP